MKILNPTLILIAITSGISGAFVSSQYLSRIFVVVALFCVLLRIMRFVAFEYYIEDTINSIETDQNLETIK